MSPAAQIGTHTKVVSSPAAADLCTPVRLRNSGSWLARGTTTGLAGLDDAADDAFADAIADALGGLPADAGGCGDRQFGCVALAQGDQSAAGGHGLGHVLESTGQCRLQVRRRAEHRTERQQGREVVALGPDGHLSGHAGTSLRPKCLGCPPTRESITQSPRRQGQSEAYGLVKAYTTPNRMVFCWGRN